ncbi:diguanylate cyclase [Rhodobacterales bacterium HKCCE2091]|nr:diguanylate cyclase [Rhodobacterales bacterium HKCCE2091]
MLLSDLATILTVLGCSTAAAVAALAISRRLPGPKGPGPRMIWGAFEAPRVYEFRDGYLVSDVGEEDVFLHDTGNRAGAWASLSGMLARINPRVPAAMELLRSTGKGFLVMGQAGADSLSIAGVAEDDRITVTVANALTGEGKLVIDAESFRRQRLEADRLARVVDAAPIVAWRETGDQRILWANAAYLRCLERLRGGEEGIVWPLPQLFGKEIRPLPEPGQSRRCRLQVPDRPDPLWFEISAVEYGTETVVIAMPADRLVAAEVALREFVQTLSKTFAELPIGLAIFDRRRELVLFNPALVTLSTLDAQFLSSRPTLFGFLDALRERRHMPEPKNYKAWRESIAKLESDAEEGTYHELWTLPMGQTYRVIGRPHPDGAIAFMFEDISSEVSLTRQFRADLDLYQSVIDQTDRALAVFSSQSELVVSNAAYARLWGHDPREILGTLSLTEATRKWESATMPAPLWGEIRDFAGQRQDRAAWSDRLDLPDRGALVVRVSPLRGGATMIGFRLADAEGGTLAPDDAADAEATEFTG